MNNIDEMTYKEVIGMSNELGYQFRFCEKYFEIYDIVSFNASGFKFIAAVSRHDLFCIEISKRLNDKELFEALVKLAKTPIEKRGNYH